MLKKILLLILGILIVVALCYRSPFAAKYNYSRAKSLYDHGKYDQAIPYFERALLSDPKSTLARFFFVFDLSKAKPTYSVQKKLYDIANSEIEDDAKKYAKTQVLYVKHKLMEGMEDNYIFNTSSGSDIVRWDKSSFPLNIYIENPTVSRNSYSHPGYDRGDFGEDRRSPYPMEFQLIRQDNYLAVENSPYSRNSNTKTSSRKSSSATSDKSKDSRTSRYNYKTASKTRTGGSNKNSYKYKSRRNVRSSRPTSEDYPTSNYRDIDSEMRNPQRPSRSNSNSQYNSRSRNSSSARNYSNSINSNVPIPDYYQNCVREAVTTWEESVDFIKFNYVTDAQKADIVVRFKSRSTYGYNNYPSYGDNSNKVNEYSAATTDPTIDHETKLLTKMNINIFTTNPKNEVFTQDEMYGTALHELGHALGIMGHSDDPNDIMFAVQSNNANVEDKIFSSGRKTLSERDLNTIKLLYKLEPTISNKKDLHSEDFYYPPVLLGSEDERLHKKIKEFQKYIKDYPHMAAGYINLASVYSDLGDFDKALSLLDEADPIAVSVDEQYLVHYNKAVVYFNMQEYKNAMMAANQAKSIKNDNNIQDFIKEIQKLK